MNTDKKIFNILWILIGITVCVCIITVSITWHRKTKLVSEWNELFLGIEGELKAGEVVPTPKNVFAVRNENKWLAVKQKEIRSLLKSKNLQISELTPLEFKEKLLSIETKLKQLANIQGSQIPEDLGFPEYAGGEIPQLNEVVLLNKQLTVINEIVDLLLKHKTDEVISIERLPYIYYSEGNLYEEIVFRIKIRCIFENLLEVLTDLSKTSFFAVVRNIKLDKVDENMVEAEFIIGVIEYKIYPIRSQNAIK